MNTIQKEVTFSYKTKKDKQTGAEFKRDPEILKISYPVVSDLVNEVGEKGLALLQEAMEAVINSRARDLLDQFTAESFPYAELDWEKIASIPPAQRRGAGIPKEQWEAFLADYCAVMPALTGKSQEQIDNASAILGRRLANVKNSKDHLKFFESQLTIYMQSESAGEYTDVLEFLTSKIEEYLSLSSEDVLKNL